MTPDYSDQFFSKASFIHNNTYDYSQTIYENSNKKVTIVCKEHGCFTQTPHNHLNGQGCPICGLKKRVASQRLSYDNLLKKILNLNPHLIILEKNYKTISQFTSIQCKECGKVSKTTFLLLSQGYGCYRCSARTIEIRDKEDFIWRSKQIHGNKYDYSKVSFHRVTEKVIIICPEHGEFETKAYLHYGICKRECPICTKERTINEIKLDVKEIEKEILSITPNIKFLSQDYKNIFSKVSYQCLKCDKIHNTTYISLRKGQKCYRCSIDKPQVRDTEDFIQRSNKVHNHFYDYDKTLYQAARKKVVIICPKHGKFLQRASSHIKGQGCPKCKTSFGENKIREFIEMNNIIYKEQYIFQDCRNIQVLPFDFAILNKDQSIHFLIEYDGGLHFKPIAYFGVKGSLTILRKWIK